MNPIPSSSQYPPPRAPRQVFCVSRQASRDTGVQGLPHSIHRQGTNWDMIMGLAIMAGVSIAGWTAIGMLIARLLR
jgi:hypothetical protein